MSNFKLLSEYPGPDESYGPGNEATWHELVKVVRRELGIPKDDDNANIIAERFDGYSVEVSINLPANYQPPTVYAAAHRIREVLRSVDGYWRVKVWLLDKREAVVWLVVDRFAVQEHLGLLEVERFRDIASFYRHHWGNDFGVKV